MLFCFLPVILLDGLILALPMMILLTRSFVGVLVIYSLSPNRLSFILTSHNCTNQSTAYPSCRLSHEKVYNDVDKLPYQNISFILDDNIDDGEILIKLIKLIKNIL